MTDAAGTIDAVLERLFRVRRSGAGYLARCPAHEDQTPSLSIRHGTDGRVLLHCFAGCSTDSIVSAIGLEFRHLFPNGPAAPMFERRPEPLAVRRRRRVVITPTPEGLTLPMYARAKGLDVGTLRRYGLTSGMWAGRPAVRVPYYGGDGLEQAVRYRVGLRGDRFRWRRGSQPFLYGLWLLERMRAKAATLGGILLVEGESDCHVCWSHGVPALGIPGVDNWREARDAPHFADFDRVFVVVEPDRGGDTVRAWLRQSAVAPRAYVLPLGVKDVGVLYEVDRSTFTARLRAVFAECLGAKRAA